MKPNNSLKQTVEGLLERKQPNKKEELTAIQQFVDNYRVEEGTTPTPGYKFELSCIHFGEGYNLLYRQLVETTNGDAGWKELENYEVRLLVLEQIKKDIK